MRYGRDKKGLEFLGVDILCINSANSNAQVKIYEVLIRKLGRSEPI